MANGPEHLALWRPMGHSIWAAAANDLDGWSFSGPSNTIRLWGNPRPAPGESLVVRYDVGIVRDGP